MWPRFINVLIGMWLTAAPDLLRYGGQARTNDHIVGPLIMTFAMIALSESMRPARWMTMASGIWLIAVPVVFGYSAHQAIHSLSLGITVVLLAAIKGVIKEQFGGGWA